MLFLFLCTQPCTVPSAPPTSISGMVTSSTMITFRWFPPPPQDINGLIRFYTVRLTERHTGRQWTFFAVDQDIRIGSLHPYYFYDFVVAAYTTGTGPFSQVFTVQTAQDVPIASPDQFSAATIASDFLTLTWVPPPFEETNGVIQYYSIRVTELETGQLFNLRSNVTNITLTNLHPYYTYQCRIAARTISLGPYSDPITIQLLEEGNAFEFCTKIQDNVLVIKFFMRLAKIIRSKLAKFLLEVVGA